MRKWVIAGAMAVAALVGIAAGGYFWAERDGATRIRAAMDGLADEMTGLATLRYGAIAYDAAAHRATIDHVGIAWKDADFEVGQVVLEDLPLGAFDPRRGRIAFHDVVDRGLLNAFIGWVAGAGYQRGLTAPSDAWASIRYDAAIDYDYEPRDRSLVVRSLTLDAPDWGELRLALSVANLPPSLSRPAVFETGNLDGPVAILAAMAESLSNFTPVLVRGAAFSYRDHGAINRILDGLAAHTMLGDPQAYYVDQCDRLKAALEGGRAATRPWDAALLEVLAGKAHIEVSLAPKSPVPVADLLRLGGAEPQDAAAILAGLELKIATAGSRPLGHFALTDAEVRAIRVRPDIMAGEAALASPDRMDKFLALLIFKQAMEAAPEEQRAAAGMQRAVAALLDAGRAEEARGDFTGPDGAVAIYREMLRRVPGNAEAAAALAAVPRHIVDAARPDIEAGTLAGADAALAKLAMSAGLAADDPAVAAGFDALAARLIAEGDARAAEGNALGGESDGALAFYRKAIAVEPANARARGALLDLAARLRKEVLALAAGGDITGAVARRKAIAARWPDFPGRGVLDQRLAALTGMPVVPNVAVFNWWNYIAPATNEAFGQKTGINLKYDTFTSIDAFNDKILGGGSGYDVTISPSAFLGRAIPAGLFLPLDKSKLPNLANLDPVIMRATEAFDPGHRYSVPYFWGAVGIAYDADAIRRRMAEAPVESWRLVFDPEVVARFRDCGVVLVDAPNTVIESALLYLGRDPASEDPGDYAAVKALLAAIRPAIRSFKPGSYARDLAEGRACLAVGWSNDFTLAQSRAEQAGKGSALRFSTPREGAMIRVDNLVIPADAPNPQAALSYINNLMDPKVAAANANHVRYASPNKAALDMGLIAAADRENPALYPPPEVMEKLRGLAPASPAIERLRARIWDSFKAGAE